MRNECATTPDTSPLLIHRFHRSACEAFPAFLDYLYHLPNDKLAATTESATALLYLGERLCCPSIFNAARDYIISDMNVANACIYIR